MGTFFNKMTFVELLSESGCHLEPIIEFRK